MKASIYDPSTGYFTGIVIGGDRAHIERNVPATFKWLAGEFDHQSQRVDLQSGEVVDYQPPRPSEEHEWNAGKRRWVLTTAAHTAREEDRVARATMALLEEGSPRALREALLELLPANSSSRVRLRAIEDAIAPHRARVKRP